MANTMLIRTRHATRKARLAVIVRVILFFGIPTLYFLFVNEPPQRRISEKHTSDATYTSRHLLGLIAEGKNCTPPAILEFPSDGFTRFQRQHGFIAVHCVLAIYCFMLLGAVCEHYFVPAIKIICEKLNMADDIAGATFMAAASSSPELFINCVGTFVTEGDIGVGAVVGSAVFNVLAVPACCGLLAGKVVDLDWWSVSRDCLMYAVAVVALILTLLDDKVYWHESLLLVSTYTLYILAMIFNGSIGKFVKSGCCVFKKRKMYTEVSPLLVKDKSNGLEVPKRYTISANTKDDIEVGVEDDFNDLESSTSTIWSWPDEKTTWVKKILWVFMWPISFVLWATVPDCKHRTGLYALTFIMCICWIGAVSYVVAWLITIIGDTLEIPDSITGLTILAAGTSLPEAVSSVLVTNQGHGSMGISNSIGSNTFDILLCLGLPWLIKSLFYPTTPGNYWITLNSSGLSYSAITLLSTLLALYTSLAMNKFRLDWRVGAICAAVYVGFIIFASLLELNVFFLVNLPMCPH